MNAIAPDPTVTASPPSPEDIAEKVNTIRSHIKIFYKSNIAKKLRISPKYLSEWIDGKREIPINAWERLCDLEISSIRKAKKDKEQRNQFEDIELSVITKEYIDKQIRMQEFRMGETILRNLIDSPKTVAELREIVGVHRQSASRKVQEMEYFGVIECERKRNHVLCYLKPGVKRFLFSNCWIDK